MYTNIIQEFNGPKSGFSLIEVLISLMILSLLLLEFDASQLFSMHQSQQNFFFIVAQEQVNAMTERIKASHNQAELSQHTQVWNRQNESLLPMGKGYVSQEANVNEITLFWGAKTRKTTCDKIKQGKLFCLHIKVFI